VGYLKTGGNEIVKKRIIVITSTIIFLIAIFFGLKTLKGNRQNKTFRTTGSIEGTEVNVSSMIAGRILKKCCREGDSVRKGQVIIDIESNELKALMEQAAAGIEKSKADQRVSASVIESARANTLAAKARISDAKAEIHKARTGMEEKKRELDRYDALFKEQIVPKATHDVALTAYEASAADYKAATARLAAAESNKNGAEAQLLTAEYQLHAAAAHLKETEAAFDVIKAKFEQTIITSPISGTVVFDAMETGEAVAPGETILTVVDLAGLYVRINVEETLVGSISLGGAVTVRTDGTGNRTFQGKIAQIGSYAEFATQKDVTRGRQDIKTFKIKIDVSDPSRYLKPGMTVTVEMPL
jgi:HlyD family secretion protein